MCGEPMDNMMASRLAKSMVLAVYRLCLLIVNWLFIPLISIVQNLLWFPWQQWSRLEYNVICRIMYSITSISLGLLVNMFKVYTTLFLTAWKTFKSKRFASTRHGCEFGLLAERAGYIKAVDLILDLPTQRWRLKLVHLSTLYSVSFLFFSNACLNREMLTFKSTKVICYFLLGFGQFCPVGILKVLQQQHCGSSSSSALFSTNSHFDMVVICMLLEEHYYLVGCWLENSKKRVWPDLQKGDFLLLMSWWQEPYLIPCLWIAKDLIRRTCSIQNIPLLNHALS